jgi:hypothetical protein
VRPAGYVSLILAAVVVAPTTAARLAWPDESLNRRFADLVLVSENPDCLVREGPMSSFDIDVTRDGGWWMVHIPELGGRTQARYPREVELMAREYIAISTGTPIDQVAINWRLRTLGPGAD